MEFKFTADQARKAVMDAHAPYPPEEVYDRIRRMAETGHVRAIFNSDRWNDELTGMLSEDGYGLYVVPTPGGRVYVTWGPTSSRKLREAVGD